MAAPSQGGIAGAGADGGEVVGAALETGVGVAPLFDPGSGESSGFAAAGWPSLGVAGDEQATARAASEASRSRRIVLARAAGLMPRLDPDDPRRTWQIIEAPVALIRV